MEVAGLSPSVPSNPATAALQTSRMHLDAWRSLLMAHTAIVERMEGAFTGAGLPPLSWYDVLAALHEAPGRRLRPRDLGPRLTISKSGLTRLVDRIAASGLIERQACPSDRRGYLLVLTHAGADVVRRMEPVYADALMRSFAETLAHDEARTLRDLLDRLTQTAAGQPAI